MTAPIIWTDNFTTDDLDRYTSIAGPMVQQPGVTIGDGDLTATSSAGSGNESGNPTYAVVSWNDGFTADHFHDGHYTVLSSNNYKVCDTEGAYCVTSADATFQSLEGGSLDEWVGEENFSVEWLDESAESSLLSYLPAITEPYEVNVGYSFDIDPDANNTGACSVEAGWVKPGDESQRLTVLVAQDASANVTTVVKLNGETIATLPALNHTDVIRFMLGEESGQVTWQLHADTAATQTGTLTTDQYQALVNAVPYANIQGAPTNTTQPQINAFVWSGYAEQQNSQPYDGFSFFDSTNPVPDGTLSISVWTDVADTDDIGAIEVGLRSGYVEVSLRRNERMRVGGLGLVFCGRTTASDGARLLELDAEGATDLGAGSSSSYQHASRDTLTSGRITFTVTSAGAVTLTTPVGTLNGLLADSGEEYTDLTGLFPYLAVMPNLANESGDSDGGTVVLDSWGYEYDFASPPQLNVGLATSGAIRLSTPSGN